MTAGDAPPSGDDGTGPERDSDSGDDRPTTNDDADHSRSGTGTDADRQTARPGPDERPPTVGDTDESGDETLLLRFWHAEDGPLMFVREVLTSAFAVVLVGLLLFAISGVWPPMVAVESGSMEPHMSRGDLVFITEPGRYASDSAVGDTGIVTHETGVETDYRTFGDHGSVIIYERPDRFGPPVIHRARLHVEAGENWYDRANPDYLDANNCEQLQYCPAPYDAFITKGDANPQYDQVSGISAPVREEDVAGIARVRVPYLGYVRLGFATATQATDDSASDPADRPEELAHNATLPPATLTPTPSLGALSPATLTPSPETTPVA